MWLRHLIYATGTAVFEAQQYAPYPTYVHAQDIRIMAAICAILGCLLKHLSRYNIHHTIPDLNSI